MSLRDRRVFVLAGTFEAAHLHALEIYSQLGFGRKPGLLTPSSCQRLRGERNPLIYLCPTIRDSRRFLEVMSLLEEVGAEGRWIDCCRWLMVSDLPVEEDPPC